MFRIFVAILLQQFAHAGPLALGVWPGYSWHGVHVEWMDLLGRLSPSGAALQCKVHSRLPERNIYTGVFLQF